MLGWGRGWTEPSCSGVCIPWACCHLPGHILRRASSCPLLSRGYPCSMEVSIPPLESTGEGGAEELMFSLSCWFSKSFPL